MFITYRITHVTITTTSYRFAARFDKKVTAPQWHTNSRQEASNKDYSHQCILSICSVVFLQSGEHSMLHARHGVHVKCRWCTVTCACWDTRRPLNCQQPSLKMHIKCMFQCVSLHLCTYQNDQVCWPHYQLAFASHLAERISKFKPACRLKVISSWNSLHLAAILWPRLAAGRRANHTLAAYHVVYVRPVDRTPHPDLRNTLEV